MGQKSGPVKEPAEQVVKEIRRATRRQFSAEEKIRIVLSGLRGEERRCGRHCRRANSEWMLECVLFIEPDVLHTAAIEDAVDHDREPLHPRLPAGPAAAIEDDRSRAILGQLPLDFPNQLLAFFLVRLDRLLVD